MKINIFLNGERGLCVLEHLMKKEYDIESVFIPKKTYDQVIVDIRLSSLRKKTYGVEDINSNELLDLYKKTKIDLNVCAGFPYIFKLDLINAAKLGTINLHAGKLPEYRGGSPLNWQIINNERHAVISIIKMDKGIDTGNVIIDKKIEINEKDYISDIHNKANLEFPLLTGNAIDLISQGETGKKQDESKASYWHQRQDYDGKIDWKQSAALDVFNLIRAVSRPYNGAYAIIEQKKVRIFKSELVKENIMGTPGKVIFLNKKGPYVVCKDRAILLTEYEHENKYVIKHGDYLQ